MSRAILASSACLVAVALVAGGAGCESTLNLSDADASSERAALTCTGTCDRLIGTCRLFPPEKYNDCVSQCVATGRQSDLVCVAQTACADIGRKCGDERDASTGSDGSAIDQFQITNCQAACDNGAFYSCLSASELSTCRALCESAAASKRDSYQACGFASGGDCPRAHDCFALFIKD